MDVRYFYSDIDTRLYIDTKFVMDLLGRTERVTKDQTSIVEDALEDKEIFRRHMRYSLVSSELKIRL